MRQDRGRFFSPGIFLQEIEPHGALSALRTFGLFEPELVDLPAVGRSQQHQVCRPEERFAISEGVHSGRPGTHRSTESTNCIVSVNDGSPNPVQLHLVGTKVYIGLQPERSRDVGLDRCKGSCVEALQQIQSCYKAGLCCRVALSLRKSHLARFLV
jgi:hypothetical protein